LVAGARNQLNLLTDWKPFSDVGPGVREIRIEVSGDDFRSLYV